ncbi:site-2 protease family protein [Candidatus Undinarchaeota archaeon]
MKSSPYQLGENELKELSIAWIILSITFALVLNLSTSFIAELMLILPTLGFGFICHELAHKFLAQKYGFWAEFRISYKNLLLALIMAQFGFVFAAPGAVMIFPVSRHGRRASLEVTGRISLAGPSANLILVVIFGFLYLVSPTFPFLHSVSQIGIMLNGFLALFNLLPISVLDGAKIFRWNKLIWGGAFLLALLALTLV